MAEIEVEIETLSPIHLGSTNADITIDADIVRDDVGLPYFPGKRLRGLLKESALEVREMISLAKGADDGKPLSDNMIVGNFYIYPEAEYRKICEEWRYLQREFSFMMTPADLLAKFTSIRYQTKLTDGVAADGSLHNMRVLDDGHKFYGTIELIDDNQSDLALLILALRNLKAAGTKRNRGFGRIVCNFTTADGRSEDELVEQALRIRGM